MSKPLKARHLPKVSLAGSSPTGPRVVSIQRGPGTAEVALGWLRLTEYRRQGRVWIMEHQMDRQGHAPRPTLIHGAETVHDAFVWAELVYAYGVAPELALDAVVDAPGRTTVLDARVGAVRWLLAERAMGREHGLAPDLSRDVTEGGQ